MRATPSNSRKIAGTACRDFRENTLLGPQYAATKVWFSGSKSHANCKQKARCKRERHQTAKRLWYSELYLFETSVLKRCANYPTLNRAPAKKLRSKILWGKELLWSDVASCRKATCFKRNEQRRSELYLFEATALKRCANYPTLNRAPAKKLRSKILWGKELLWSDVASCRKATCFKRNEQRRSELYLKKRW